MEVNRITMDSLLAASSKIERLKGEGIPTIDTAKKIENPGV